eukprot:gene17255-biopygen5958
MASTFLMTCIFPQALRGRSRWTSSGEACAVHRGRKLAPAPRGCPPSRGRKARWGILPAGACIRDAVRARQAAQAPVALAPHPEYKLQGGWERPLPVEEGRQRRQPRAGVRRRPKLPLIVHRMMGWRSGRGPTARPPPTRRQRPGRTTIARRPGTAARRRRRDTADIHPAPAAAAPLRAAERVAPRRAGRRRGARRRGRRPAHFRARAASQLSLIGRAPTGRLGWSCSGMGTGGGTGSAQSAAARGREGQGKVEGGARRRRAADAVAAGKARGQAERIQGHDVLL